METLATLSARVGGLSEPSKMPGFGYSIPAADCKIGSMLRKVEGSTCEKCYALKGRYVFGIVQKAMKRRLESISRPSWTRDMSELIARKSGDMLFFRWHDSGDLQSPEHLEKIVAIARNLPKVAFWLPTRETAIVKQYLRGGRKFPKNLVVRVSAPMIGRAPEKIAGTVGSSVSNPSAFQCPAPKQANTCGKCRACWDFKVKEVSYKKH